MKQAHTSEKRASQPRAASASKAAVNETTNKGKKGPRSVSTDVVARGGTETKGKENRTIAVEVADGGAAAVLGVQDVLLTTEQLSIRIGFSVRKVRQYARTGRLPAVRLNKRDIRFHWPTVVRRLTGAQ